MIFPKTKLKHLENMLAVVTMLFSLCIKSFTPKDSCAFYENLLSSFISNYIEIAMFSLLNIGI